MANGAAVGWVRVVEAGDSFMVRVWAHAAYDVQPSARLLPELNEIQIRSLSASIRLAGHIVSVERTISPIGLTQPVLAQALDAVCTVADDVGLLLAATFGGRTPIAATATSESEDAA